MPSETSQREPVPAGQPRSRLQRIWRHVRRIWVTVGVGATIVFVTWSLWAYRASPEAWTALTSDDRVRVVEHEDYRAFLPRSGTRPTGLAFFAGALVDPVAYAPLVRAVAEHGYTVLLVSLPRRSLFGAADGAEVLERAVGAMADHPDVDRWVVGGHSKGGAVAARLVRERPGRAAGLALVGTTHPRDFSLAAASLPTLKVLGSNDGVAELEASEALRANLPEGARWVVIDGGNHSQFGHYGFQPGDGWAEVSRAEQQQQTVAALLELLARVDGNATG